MPYEVIRTAVLAPLFLFGVGCSFGPKVLEKTHGRYAESVRRVEDEQLLRQLVLLRYNETAVNLDISNIAAQYELSASAEARPFFIAPNPSNSNIVFRTFTAILPDASLSGSNRPTVTLTPHTDGAATRRFLTPITVETLIFLTQTSWPVDTVLRMWVERINGVPNAVTASKPGGDATPDYERFLRAVELFRVAQQQELAAIRTEERVTEMSGPVPADAVTTTAAVEAAKNGFEYRPRGDEKTWVLVRKERRLVVEVSPGAENAPELHEMAGLLGLVPGQSRYAIAVSDRGGPDPLKFPGPPTTELRIVPRSTAQTAFFLANGVEVPPEHVCSGIVHVPDTTPVTRGLFDVKVYGGHRPPPTAFVAIRYRGFWYYIDDRDQASKTTFALMLHLSRLDFARDPLRGPTLTLPIGR